MDTVKQDIVLFGETLTYKSLRHKLARRNIKSLIMYDCRLTGKVPKSEYWYKEKDGNYWLVGMKIPAEHRIEKCIFDGQLPESEDKDWVQQQL